MLKAGRTIKTYGEVWNIEWNEVCDEMLQTWLDAIINKPYGCSDLKKKNTWRNVKIFLYCIKFGHSYKEACFKFNLGKDHIRSVILKIIKDFDMQKNKHVKLLEPYKAIGAEWV